MEEYWHFDTWNSFPGKTMEDEEPGGSVVECLTWVQGVVGLSLNRGTLVCPMSKTLYPMHSTGSLPKKTRLDSTENCWLKTNKQTMDEYWQFDTWNTRYSFPGNTIEQFWHFDTWYSFPGYTMEEYWQFDTWYSFPGYTMEEYWQFDTWYSFPGYTMEEYWQFDTW